MALLKNLVFLIVDVVDSCNWERGDVHKSELWDDRDNLTKKVEKCKDCVTQACDAYTRSMDKEVLLQSLKKAVGKLCFTFLEAEEDGRICYKQAIVSRNRWTTEGLLQRTSTYVDLVLDSIGTHSNVDEFQAFALEVDAEQSHLLTKDFGVEAFSQ
eukprot:3204012-Rhodomonas_salina.1